MITTSTPVTEIELSSLYWSYVLSDDFGAGVQLILGAAHGG